MSNATTATNVQCGAPPMRWVIAGLLFLASVLNYVDRQALSILAPTIQRELGISDSGYALVVQLFLLCYTIMYLGSGRIVDRIGTRLAETAFILWWSLANMAASLVNGIVSLAVVRSLLGLGEPGNFTAGAKAVSEWFPPRERALAVGVYSMGGTIGAAIAAPLVAGLALAFGWRAAFLATGAAGLPLALLWHLLYRKPGEARTGRAAAMPLRRVLRNRVIWCVLLSRMITDPLWYFYLFWFPKYLQDSRGFSLADVGATLWVVFVAADAGCLAGGWWSGRQVRLGLAPANARLRVMGFAAILLACSFVMPSLSGRVAPLAAASLFAMAHMMWMTNSTTLPIDLVSPEEIGSAQGAVGAGSSLGGFLSAGLIGMVVTRTSYDPLFVAMSLLHPAAFLLLWRLLPRKKGTSA